ncbi:4-(cytidine 5'-diphospho)-2-C-methyl-D-erythritol kinase [Pseudomonas sp. R2.Fl]|nr:4-(cytidine 5'-diphospho)-2-C-methyl-D-erythritol kinase [Pseudomonas sp. R2.Fl]
MTVAAGPTVPPDGSIVVTAPAKINLALHVTGQRDDGYHLLDMIVTFAGVGDVLSISTSDQDGFQLQGRFGASLSSSGEGHDGNLVLRARDRLRQALGARGIPAPPVAITLQKNLPIASGIGGGSADAAATLKGLLALWNATLPEAKLMDLALSLGADVPMCLAGWPLRATGIGENVERLADMPGLPMVLGNPLKGVSTPDIFRRLTRKTNPPVIGLPSAPASKEDWLAFLAGQRNDLEPPARALLPEIAELSGLLTATGARLVRMSGSGATCFGLYDDFAAARNAEARLLRERPDWYFAATETSAGA